MNTLEHRRIYQSLILLYKSLYCHDPGYIRNFFNFKESNYHLRGSGVNLSLPKFNPKRMNNSYTYKVAKIWNSLKIDLRQESLKTFVRKIGDIKF